VTAIHLPQFQTILRQTADNGKAQKLIKIKTGNNKNDL
jgi:hypothetical protein